jgi:hypothetical protein
MGDEDIGIDLNKSQRQNGNGSALVDKVGTGVQGAMGYVTDTTKDAFSNASADGLSSLAKGSSTWAEDMFRFATPEKITAVLDSINKDDFGIKDKPKKLNLVIKLPMPQEGLNVNYSMNYENANMGFSGAIVDSVVSGQTLSDLLKTAKGPALRAIAGYAVGVLDDKVGGGAMGDVNALGEALTRTILSPRKEQLFKSVNYRRFSYTFNFAANNASECDTIKTIIGLFKRHMCPTLSLQSFYLRYPSEFLISYIFNDTINPYIHNIGNCALEDLNIAFSRGSFSTLINGHPTVVSMNAKFLELEPLSRNRLESEGF